ncbi:restriction endonuclease subunit S [Bacillus cereus]|uniref:Restriction endonuclease subunit S n=1 Tax=Bacillus cereus TaxID=1396 RepID=A0AB34DBZ7_BACCE|nr:restriction endonuclease subunit S [Bacillus cereus]KAB2501024.1 restriction endonuclease subunit S [Bacillus cereus]
MKNKRTPEVRFPEFSGEWEKRNLGNISTKIGSGKTPKGGNQNYKSEGIPLLRSQNIFNDKVNFNDVVYITPEIDEDMANSRVQKGDVLLNITGASIGRSAVYKLNHKANVNQHVSIIRPSGEVNPYFIQLNITSEKGQKQIELNQAGGGREGLNFQQIAKMRFYFPSLVEQTQIGNFLKQLDDMIAFHQQELTILKQTKQGFLQKMFPKEGESVPEIRFPEFTGEWELRKLSSLTNYKNGKGHEDRQSDSGKYELINLNSISIDGGLKHSGKFVDESPEMLKKDDLVMVLSDVGHGDLLGRVALIPENDKFVLNQRVALLRPYNTVSPLFLFSYINRHQKYFKAQGAGMSQLNISRGSVENFEGLVPSLDEQVKIGEFFKQLDETITLHQRELDALKETKKAFLQKMFA